MVNELCKAARFELESKIFVTALGACGEYLLSLALDSFYVCVSVGKEAHSSGGVNGGRKG